MRDQISDEIFKILPKRLILSAILAVFASAFFVLNDAIIKFVAMKDVEFYHFIFYGTPAYLVVPIYLLLLGKASEKLGATNYKIPLLRGLIFLPMPLLTFLALESISLPEFTTLAMTAPLFSVVFSVFLLKEKNNIFLVISLLFGIGGVFLVMKPGFDSFDPFFLLVLLNAFLIAMSTFIVNKFDKITSSEGYFFYGGIFVHMLSIILFILDPMFFDLHTSALMIFASIFVNLAIFLVVVAFKTAQDFYGSISCLNYLQILWSVIIGGLFFEQALDFFAAIGSFLIVLSGFFSVPAQAWPIRKK